jgi:hypothetical protein
LDKAVCATLLDQLVLSSFFEQQQFSAAAAINYFLLSCVHSTNQHRKSKTAAAVAIT